MLRLHRILVYLKQNAKEDRGLTLGQRCVLHNKMPELDAVVLIIIEEGDQPLQEILA